MRPPATAAGTGSSRAAAGRGDAGPGVPQPSQRPPVGQQQQEGEGDQHRFGHQAEGEEPQRRQVTRRRRAAQVPEPGHQRQHAEEPGQQVLALREPGHRLDPQRVEGEQRGDGQGDAPAAGQAGQQGEEEDGNERVDRDADQVMGAGVHAEQGHVELVRQPGDRVPVGGVQGGHGPANRGGGQAAGDGGVVGQVDGVVILQEGVATQRGEDGHDDQEERQGGRDFRPAWHGAVEDGPACRFSTRGRASSSRTSRGRSLRGRNAS